MRIASQGTWPTEWPIGEPPAMGYVSAPADEGEWVAGPWPHLEQKDLGLGGVSAGLLGARRVRVRGDASDANTGWHCHDVAFEFLYVLRGSAVVVTASGERLTLEPGAAGIQPPLYWHRECEASSDFEFVEITSPARVETVRAAGDSPQNESDAARQEPHYTYDTPENYEFGAGPRAYFNYRDLGAASLSDGRLHIHVIRATGEPGAGTGWHYHTMAQWFMILGGASVIRVEREPRVELGLLDSMCIGRGPEMRHNVAPFTGDYAVLELCVPATYETIPVPPPEGADTPPEGARE